MLLKQGISPDLPREEANAPMMSADIRIIGDEKGNPVDIEILRSGSLPLRMLGPGGPAREEAVLAPLDQAGQEVLPVLLGLGMGHALRASPRRSSGMAIEGACASQSCGTRHACAHARTVFASFEQKIRSGRQSGQDKQRHNN